MFLTFKVGYFISKRGESFTDVHVKMLQYQQTSQLPIDIFKHIYGYTVET